jgi:single-strand DNA-binding protein
MSLNLVVIAGNLGRDPEIRYTQKGDPVAGFSIAVNERWKGGESTNWFKVSAFAKTAEFVKNYLHKGSSVIIEGSLREEKWADKDGNNRTTVSINARRISFNGPKPTSEGGGSRDDDPPF